MLKFQTPPDKIFMAILTGSMEIMIDQIRELQAVHRKKEIGAGALESLMAHATRVFVPETALKTLKNMLHCHAGPGLYRLNDYHYLLLYDTLEYFCDIHNDMVLTAPNAREKKKASRIAGVHIERIDFDDLIDIYFFDTDFLIDEDVVMNLGLERRKGLGIHDETFGISQGLTPHPEELKIREEKDEKPVLNIQTRYWGPFSRVYPDLEEADKNTDGEPF
jgi:hypothetical protein